MNWYCTSTLGTCARVTMKVITEMESSTVLKMSRHQQQRALTRTKSHFQVLCAQKSTTLTTFPEANQSFGKRIWCWEAVERGPRLLGKYCNTTCVGFARLCINQRQITWSIWIAWRWIGCSNLHTVSMSLQSTVITYERIIQWPHMVKQAITNGIVCCNLPDIFENARRINALTQTLKRFCLLSTLFAIKRTQKVVFVC